MATALTPQTDVTSGEDYTNKNQLKTQFNIFISLYFIKSETSDSFVNHFDGHFAYIKTLDFYFKKRTPGWLKQSVYANYDPSRVS